MLVTIIRLWICFLLFFNSSFAQNSNLLHFSQTDLKAYKYCEKFEIQEAKKLLQETKNLSNKTPLNKTQHTGILIENYADFLQLICNENENQYLELLDNEEVRLNDLKQFSDDTTYKFCQAEIKLQWAFVHLKFGHEWRAFQNIRQSFKLLKESEKLYPNFLPQQRSLGLLYILLSAVPENYQWALSVFGLEGNEQKGINYLQNVAQSNHFYANEAKFILALAQIFILKQPEKALLSVQLYDLERKTIAEPENLVQSFVLSWVYLKAGKAKKVVAINEQIVDTFVDKTTEKIAEPITNSKQNIRQNPNENFNKNLLRCDILLRFYVYAEALLLSNNLQKSEKYYMLYSKYLEGNLYLKDCYYKLFLIHYLQNNIAKANQYKQLILLKGAEKSSNDRYAMIFAKKNIILNKNLLIVRLLSDGGEYVEALQKLTQIDTNTLTILEDKVEYYYRTARILHKQKKYQTALHHYQIVVSKPFTQSYFAPNSALQMALIYVELQQLLKAKYYANLVENYKNYEYENSIRGEAKRLLRKL